MKKIIICVIGVLIAIAGISGKVLVDNKNKRPSNDILQVAEKGVNEDIKEITENDDEGIIEEESEEKKNDITPEKEKDNTSKLNSSVKTDTSKSSSNNEQPKKEETIPSDSQSNSQINNEKKEESNSTQNNTISTTFYDSITHGKREYKTEAEAISRGNQIVDNELNYVLDYNETHFENQMQPSINYYRIYPSAIDENGQYWYYLHFFTTSGEGQDDILKSKF